MKIITFSAIKGGVGKTSLSILTANILNTIGKQVLVIDLDIQNSLSFYYSPDPGEIESKNMAKAIIDGLLIPHIISGGENKPDLIASSFSLISLRSMPVPTMKNLLEPLNDIYDYCIIDTAPTLDNIVLSAISASDQILTPVKLSQFDWKSALFYEQQLILEGLPIDKWNILISFFKNPRSNNTESEQNQYLNIFKEEFGNRILDTTIPDTVFIQKAVDMNVKITTTDKKRRLFYALDSLCKNITGNSPVDHGVVFF